MTLTILGAPRSKKNSQRIFRNPKGRPFITQSKEHNLWAEKAVWQLRNQWRQLPLEVPVNMAAVVYREKATGDLLNFLAAISDALEAAGVVKDDKLIVALDGCRLAKDARRPRVEIELLEVRP